MEDEGNYTCNAENVYGNDKVSYSVIIVEPPVPPSLQFFSSTKQTVTLKWKNHGDGGSPITGRLLYSPSFESKAIRTVPSSTVSYSLHLRSRLICSIRRRRNYNLRRGRQDHLHHLEPEMRHEVRLQFAIREQCREQ